jgi:cell wall assembly regulator SMI1
MVDQSTTVAEWKAWLTAWNRELLGQVDFVAEPRLVEDGVTSEVRAAGWLGYPPATYDQITRLEARLGKTLPLSYRHFLEASNGFRQPGVMVWRMLPAEVVDWYRSRHQSTIETWKQNEDLSNTLEISARERYGTAVFLLDAGIIDPAGEWEAVYFAHWIPGSFRYRSLRALMQWQYQQIVLFTRHVRGRLEKDDDLSMILIKFPSLIDSLDRKIRSLAEDPYLVPLPWSKKFAANLQTARLQLLEVRQRADSPDALLKSLYELLLEFNKRGERRSDSEPAQDHETSSRHGWYSAASTIMGFLNSRHAPLIRRP